ncbi:MAG: 16S rRNA (cytosine(1402)-N(4))-methyltransferase RsmH [Candidatus Omnitrophica bacterium]|nr:16S rRNA (cytosine(1402)-N(4))-methyltransferase RsmH [Candidatus Omnitrophota bacterium]
MPKEVCEFLSVTPGGVYVDGTLGLGGHAEMILKSLGGSGRLIAIDQDLGALDQAQKRLVDYKDRCVFVHDNFKNIDAILNARGEQTIDGALLDLGVSSYQLDEALRGFSIKGDGPLDMRMNSQGPVSAYELVNSLPEAELERIIREYGEDRFSKRIAKSICYHRAIAPIATTEDLRRVVSKAMPPGRAWQKIHPATRTFQAFRIAVNQELDVLNIGLRALIPRLKRGGRIVVISFHSLEDRIVKNIFKEEALAGHLQILTKKPLTPSDEEAQGNPRSRSAKLRAAERN